MDELIQKLSQGSHPVVASRSSSASELKKAIDRKFVLIKFTDTQGGTELGMRLEDDGTDLQKADFETPAGVAHLVGSLVLNYVSVRCIADVDLATLQGTGHLEVQPGS
jgi:hypothetical protein